MDKNWKYCLKCLYSKYVGHIWIENSLFSAPFCVCSSGNDHISSKECHTVQKW